MTRPYKAARISAELEALRNADGMIVPAEVVAWAKRHRNSALYAELIWDDEVAADKWRLWQVRQLISVHIVDAEGHRRYVSLSIDRTHGGGYRSVDDVVSRVDWREVLLNDAFEDLSRMHRKYQHLQELAGVWAAKEEAEIVVRRARRKTAA